MNLEPIEQLAVEFWERAGVPRTFPCDLEPVLSLATPGCVVRLENLRPLTIRRWLLRRGVRLPIDSSDRQLDGCIMAFRGMAIIFLAAGLAAAAARLVLAHEMGHFLAHYDWPRRRALSRLGTAILPVLDGERPLTNTAAVAGVLAGVQLGAHTHFMERTFDPRSILITQRVERTASELGCELLAPRQEVLTRVRILKLGDQTGYWEQLLRDEFGFPVAWANLWVAHLRLLRNRQRRFSDYLGL